VRAATQGAKRCIQSEHKNVSSKRQERRLHILDRDLIKVGDMTESQSCH